MSYKTFTLTVTELRILYRICSAHDKSIQTTNVALTSNNRDVANAAEIRAGKHGERRDKLFKKASPAVREAFVAMRPDATLLPSA